jgi:hypothetical protein
MSEINQSFLDRVRYTLFHDVLGSILINEPTGWKEDEKEYTRNEDYDGIVAQFSNSLVFVDEAAEFVNLVKELYGIQTDIRLTKDIRHPKTDIWENEYFGYLDLSTWTKEKKGVSLKFNAGGLQEQIKARESDEVELERLTSMDGKVIDPMPYQTLKYEGRRIFLRSKWEGVTPPDNELEIRLISYSPFGDYFVSRSKAAALALNLVNSSHVEAASVSTQSFSDLYENDVPVRGNAPMMFFLQAERARTVNLNLDLSFKTAAFHSGLQSGRFRASITIYESESYVVRERITLLDVSLADFDSVLGVYSLGNYIGGVYYPGQYDPVTHNLVWQGPIVLNQGDSIGIEFLSRCKGEVVPGALDGYTPFYIKITDQIVNTFSLDEDSVFQPTNSKFYLPYEAFERLIEIYTGKKGVFKSKALGRVDIGYSQDGQAALLGINHGFWVRQFDALPASSEDNPNLYKPLTTSIRNFMDSFSTVDNLSMGIEKDGYQEKIVVEDKSYFYNRNVTIELPNQVKNVKRSIALKYIYSAIEIGYDKGGSYDEAFGLDEYNGKNNFSTIITKTKNTFTRISNYRADSYGKEFCRRKPFAEYPSLDTQYDSDIFINDLKRGNAGIFNERVWQDDFSQAPIGIFSPETATNLRISPINLLLKHGWQIMAGLTKNVTDYIRYTSSTGNSAMKTKLISTGVEYAENGNIIGSELTRARYQAEYVEFDHIVEYEINKKLQGSTIFNGEKVLNFYGMISFINEDNQTEKGWLISVKPNKEGKWKLLKFNNNI